MKIEKRRKCYEEKAAAEKARQNQTADEQRHWEELSPILDQAMAELRRSDRQSILLRYFEGLSVREVAGAMTLSEEATKKRLSRGLDRLRRLLGKKGVVVESRGAGGDAGRAGDGGCAGGVGDVDRVLVAGHRRRRRNLRDALAEKAARSMLLRTAWVAGIAATVLVAVVGWRFLAMQDSAEANVQGATTAPSAVTPVANMPIS